MQDFKKNISDIYIYIHVYKMRDNKIISFHRISLCVILYNINYNFFILFKHFQRLHRSNCWSCYWFNNPWCMCDNILLLLL